MTLSSTRSASALAVGLGLFVSLTLVSLAASSGALRPSGPSPLTIAQPDKRAPSDEANEGRASPETKRTAEPASIQRSHRRSQARDGISLPFFSFAHILRRGNRS